MPTELPQFMANLSTATETNAQNITTSSSTILAITAILDTIASISQTILVSEPIMTVSIVNFFFFTFIPIAFYISLHSMW